MNKLHEVVQKFRSSSESSDKGGSIPLTEEEAAGKSGKNSSSATHGGDRGLLSSTGSIFTTTEANQPLNPDLLSQGRNQGQSQGGGARSRPWSGFLPDLSFPSTKIPASASASGNLSSVGGDQHQPSTSTSSSQTSSSSSTTTNTAATSAAPSSSLSSSTTAAAATTTATATTMPSLDSGSTSSISGGGGGGGEEHRQLYQIQQQQQHHLQQQQQEPVQELTRTYSKSKKKQPPGTFEYTIRERDTLCSIAARYELTPSELMKVNRMVSRTVFAGQVIFVPDPTYAAADHAPASPDADSRPKVDVPLTSLGDRSPSSVPGRVVKLSSPPATSASITVTDHPPPSSSTSASASGPPGRQLSKEETEDDEDDRECHQKFVKIRSRRILEDGDNSKKENFGSETCKGTLLVTPNAIMFDPDVSDDYVIKNGGQAKFSAVIYMENIKGAVLLPDTRSRFFWRQPEEIRSKSPKPEVYRPEQEKNMDAPDSATRGPPDGHSADSGSAKKRDSPDGAPGTPDEDKVGGRMSEELENMKEFSQGYGMSISTPGRTSEEIASTFISEPSPSIHLQKHMSRSSELAVSEISLFEDSSNSKTFGETRDFGPHMGLSSSEMIRNDSVSSQNNQPINSPGVEAIASNGGNGNGSQSVLECITDAGGLNTPTQGFAPVFFTDRSPSSAIAAPKPVPGQKASGMLLSANLSPNQHQPTGTDNTGNSSTNVGSSNRQQDCLEGGDTNLAQKYLEGNATASVITVSQSKNGNGSSTVNENSSSSNAAADVNTISQPMQNLNLSNADTQKPFSSSAMDNNTADNCNNGAPSIDVTDGPSSSAGRSTMPSSSIPSSHSSSFSPLRNPAQHLSSFINYTTGFFKAGEGNNTGVGSSSSSSNGNNNKTSPGGDETCGGVASNTGTPKSGASASGKIGKGLSAFPFPSSLIPEAISSNFPSFSLMSSSQTTPASPSTAMSGITQSSSVSSKRSEELTTSLGPPLSSYLPRSDSPQFEDPPMYLQIRVGIPADAEDQPRRPHAIVKRVKGRLLEEYWFLIPRSTRSKVYKFIIEWRPEVYGDQEQCQKREHFFYDTRDVMHLIQPIGMPKSPRSPNSAEERLNIVDDHFTVDESWEILSHMDADPHNIFIDKCPQDDLNLPEFINGPSDILTPQHVIKLMSALPVNMSVGYNWALVFSTSRHGFSLNQLYREMREMDQNLPVVLCLTDTDQNVFGAYLSTTIRISETFYGSGSTFLFTFYPEFKHFHWEGDNFYFMNGCKDSFAVGSGEGLFGLWLDGDLDKGRSHECTTFHNDILTPDEDFHIVHVEAWQLTDDIGSSGPV